MPSGVKGRDVFHRIDRVVVDVGDRTALLVAALIVVSGVVLVAIAYLKGGRAASPHPFLGKGSDPRFPAPNPEPPMGEPTPECHLRWADDGGALPVEPSHDFVDPRSESVSIRMLLSADEYREFEGIVDTLGARRRLDSIAAVVLDALRQAIVSETHL